MKTPNTSTKRVPRTPDRLSAQNTWVPLALHILAADLAGELGIAEVAARVCMSKAHFFSAFRKRVGQTPHQWRLRQRISAAQNELLNLPTTTSEIALKYGFSDQAHFTRAFKRIVGETPSSWRSRVRATHFNISAEPGRTL
ncbi:AraC family transcriptional regulator [Paraburkholderia sp. JHI869]|uniref:helix-turn-helix domain-containing protein n=1 Tax=Paraburkholderia sp. JHI869 TaxID=3112959 RepID=UPI003173F12D